MSAVGVGREFGQELLHVAMAHVGMRVGRQFARQAGHEAEVARMAVGERAELVAIQQLARRARAEQQHDLEVRAAAICCSSSGSIARYGVTPVPVAISR